MKLKVRTEFPNVWGEYKNHSNPYIHSTTVLCDTQYFLVAGTVITCTPPKDCLLEGETFMLTCSRSLDLSVESKIEVVSLDGSAKG